MNSKLIHVLASYVNTLAIEEWGADVVQISRDGVEFSWDALVSGAKSIDLHHLYWKSNGVGDYSGRLYFVVAGVTFFSFCTVGEALRCGIPIKEA